MSSLQTFFNVIRTLIYQIQTSKKVHLTDTSSIHTITRYQNNNFQTSRQKILPKFTIIASRSKSMY